jgi:hypothetical protein
MVAVAMLVGHVCMPLPHGHAAPVGLAGAGDQAPEHRHHGLQAAGCDPVATPSCPTFRISQLGDVLHDGTARSTSIPGPQPPTVGAAPAVVPATPPVYLLRGALLI